jgi:hypothetical protein
VSKSFLLSLFLLAGCFDTSYHLVTPGDEHAELAGAPAPDGWKLPGFDDRAWTRTMARTVDGAAPGASAAERFTFDVGADVESIRGLTLTLPGDGRFEAYINGQAMSGSGSARSLAVPAGLLKPAGNVLALVFPSLTAATKIAPTLDDSRGSAAPGPRITRGPYLLAPTAGGATIVWETSLAAPSSAVVDGKSFDGGSGKRHVATITGLPLSRSYPYHVEVGGDASPEAHLITAPRPGEPIRFAVFGDNRTNGDAHRRLVEALVAEAPDVVVNTGDMVGESEDSEWKTFFDIEYELIANTPLLAAIGNHEVDYGDDDMFKRLFPIAGSSFHGRVYSADWGDAHFAMLDSNGDLGAQSRWLDGDLSAAEARGARHTFVVLHWGPWCGVNKMSHGNNDDAIASIVPVAKKHGVAAIFSGHNHVYERGADGELRYVVAGGGGAPLDTPGRVKQTLVTRAVNSYVIVDVAGGRVHITAKDEASVPFDEAEWSAAN